jgi:Cu-processing system permease protein
VTRVLAVARNTVREAMRERIAVTAVLFGLALVGASEALAPLALGEGKKVVTDFGLAGSSILAALLAVTLGSSLLHKETERRTIYAILAKPIRRVEFLLGKFLGLWATAAGLLAAMTAIVIVVLASTYRDASWVILDSFLLTLVELLVVTAFVVFYSSFTSPGLTTLFTVATLAAGHFADDLLYFATHGAPWALSAAIGAVYWMLPHLDVFNARGLVSHGTAVAPERLLFAASYGLLYTGAVLAAAASIFERREFR